MNELPPPASPGEPPVPPSSWAAPPSPPPPPPAASMSAPPPAEPRSLPSPGEPSLAPPAPAPAAAAGATDAGSWPFADKQVVVQGRTMSIEVLIVAGLYAACGLWLLWAMRDLFEVIPDMFEGLFDENSFVFAISWLVLLIVSILLYLVVALLGVAYLLFRVDPLGRALTVVIAANLLAMLATSSDGVPGSLVVITLVSCACAGVLFMSPWVRRGFLESPRRRGRPEAVVLATAVAVAFYSLIGWVVLIGLPGLRFAGDLGTEWVLLLLSYAASSVLAFIALQPLRKGVADRSARLKLTIACGVTLLGGIIGGDDGGTIVFFGSAAGAIMVPLWLMSSAREWFGDKPLSTTAQQ